MNGSVQEIENSSIQPLSLALERRRWPHRLYFIGWILAVASIIGAILIGMARRNMTTEVKAEGIGLFILGSALMAVLVVTGLDRPWPRRRYHSIEADNKGLIIIRRGPSGGENQILEWANIESVEVERHPLLMEVRVIGEGADRGKSLKLSSLAWTGLDELVREILARSPAVLVEGRRGRSGEEYF